MIRRSRVQIILPATRWICVWWSQIQLLDALQIANWSSSRQLGFLTSFCLIYNLCLLISVLDTSRLIFILLLSTLNWKPLYFLSQISSNISTSKKSVMFINCGLHAREWITISSCVYVARKVCVKIYCWVHHSWHCIGCMPKGENVCEARGGGGGGSTLASSSLAILSARSPME